MVYIYCLYYNYNILIYNKYYVSTIHISILILGEASILDEANDIIRLNDLLKAKNTEGFKTALTEFDLETLETKGHSGFTILQKAVKLGRKDFVDIILNFEINGKRIDVNHGNGSKKPILLAAEYGHSRILESFMNPELRVDFDVCTEKRGDRGARSGQENVLHLGNCIITV